MTEERNEDAKTLSRLYKVALEDACKDLATIDALKQRVRDLEALIRAHKEDCTWRGRPELPVDTELWAALGGEQKGDTQ